MANIIFPSHLVDEWEAYAAAHPKAVRWIMHANGNGGYEATIGPANAGALEAAAAFAETRGLVVKAIAERNGAESIYYGHPDA